MKLKYKKMILIISMSAMGIGMITLSLSGTKSKKDSKEQPAVASVDSEQETTTDDAESTTTDATNKLTVVGKPGDGELRMDVYPQINELVKKYMSAKVTCDYDTIRTLVSDASVIDEADLKAKSEYIEDYKNIACYTLNGPTEDTFVVYVYEDLKILNVNTLAPGMTRLYIKLDENGNPYIYLGAIDDETQKFIEETAKNEAVVALINTVNTKLDEAVTSDAALKKFIEDRSAATTDKSSKEDAEKEDSTKKETTKKEDTSKDKDSSDSKSSTSKSKSSSKDKETKSSNEKND